MPRYQFNFEAIHAKWPAYPAGHGESYALETLCWYPSGTHFRVVDDIDKCFLLVAAEYLDQKQLGDLFSPSHHHVALWHEDLRRLRDAGFVDGFLPPPTAAYLREFWSTRAREMPEEIRAELIAHAQGFDWESYVADYIHRDDLSEATLALEGLTVTSKGWTNLWSFVETPALNAYFEGRLLPLLRIGYYDSAVREASILLESDLRSRTGTDLFGRKLVDRYAADISHNYGRMGAFQSHLRAELRTLFKFIRNEFAHHIVNLPQGRCHAMLRRISAIYEMLGDADLGMGSFQDIIPAADDQAGTPSPSSGGSDDIPF